MIEIINVIPTEKTSKDRVRYLETTQSMERRNSNIGFEILIPEEELGNKGSLFPPLTLWVLTSADQIRCYVITENIINPKNRKTEGDEL